MRSAGWRLACVLCLAVAAPGREPQDSNECLICHNNPSFVQRDDTGELRSLYVDPARFFHSVHGGVGCLGCHTTLAASPHVPSASPKRRLDVLPLQWQRMVAVRPERQRVAVAGCMGCHPKEAEGFAESIHGTKAAQGDRSVPLCHDCHSAHYVDPAQDIESSVNPEQVTKTCAYCHSDARRMARFNVTTAVVTTYETSFHGKKRSLGGSQAAVCTSCHGVHDIRAPEDPRSSVNPANAPATCGQCHPGADAAFAASFKHQVPERATSPVVYWVGRLYQVVIVVTIGVMLLYIVLDVYRTRGWRRRGAT